MLGSKAVLRTGYKSPSREEHLGPQEGGAVGPVGKRGSEDGGHVSCGREGVRWEGGCRGWVQSTASQVGASLTTPFSPWAA